MTEPATNPVAPVLFISHGAPTFATEPGELGRQLGQLGQTLQGIRAIVAVSPHWQTSHVEVTSHESPATVHDFLGFPGELYAITYPVPGCAKVAREVADVLASAGMPAQLNPAQGLDHGVWVPMLHLRPQADIPVICVSLPTTATPEYAWQLGRALGALRHHGILIMGTGSMTHNLSEYRGSKVTDPSPYVLAFSNWMRDRLERRECDALLAYRSQAPHAQRAHPTEEHVLAVFVALGASDEDDQFDVISEEVRYGMLSMASFAWRSQNTGVSATTH
jgi:4,5-DOPA dioxygenase extradiol